MARANEADFVGCALKEMEKGSPRSALVATLTTIALLIELTALTLPLRCKTLWMDDGVTCGPDVTFTRLIGRNGRP